MMIWILFTLICRCRLPYPQTTDRLLFTVVLQHKLLTSVELVDCLPMSWWGHHNKVLMAEQEWWELFWLHNSISTRSSNRLGVTFSLLSVPFFPLRITLPLPNILIYALPFGLLLVSIIYYHHPSPPPPPTALHYLLKSIYIPVSIIYVHNQECKVKVDDWSSGSWNSVRTDICP